MHHPAEIAGPVGAEQVRRSRVRARRIVGGASVVEDVFDCVHRGDEPALGLAGQGFEERSDVIRRAGVEDGIAGSAARRKAQEAAAGRKYDLVLVDPPYRMYPELQPQLQQSLPPVLAVDGLLVVETDARVEPDLPLPLRTSRKYGQTRITLFEGARFAAVEERA